MKPGSKGWMLFMKKLFCFSEAVLLAAIVTKFLLWEIPELKSPFRVTIVNVSLMTGVFNLVIIYALSIFAPINTKPDWSLVYKELKQDQPKKRRKY